MTVVYEREREGLTAVWQSQGEDDLPFKIPESGVLEFDYVGA